MPASKRFEINSEDSYDSTKNTFEKGQSFGNAMLENKKRGHKRWRKEDRCPEFEFTKAKKPISSTQSSSNEVINLLSDDDDDIIILDSPPPDKGYSKRSTGNKPHRRKTGSKK